MAEDDDCREKQRAASVGAMRVSRLFTIPIISDNQVPVNVQRYGHTIEQTETDATQIECR